MRRIAPALLAVLCLLSACSGQAPQPPVSRLTFPALDTVVSISCYGENSGKAAQEIGDSIRSMESRLSRTAEGSAVYAINHADGTPIQVNRELADILTRTQELSLLTEGAFDVTIAPAADLWGFTGDVFHVPTQEELEQVRPLVGMAHLHLEGDTLQLDRGSGLDLGGIAKGYALEQALEVVRQNGLDSGLVNLGGDLLACGPGPAGAPWRIGIRDPGGGREGEGTIGTLLLTDRYILTSGGYERYFEADGRRWSHILDPLTCVPADSGLTSVTVAAPLEAGSGTAADALATALFTMGAQRAAAFWRDQGRWFDMVLVDGSGKIYVTEGLREQFAPQPAAPYVYVWLS